MARFNMTPDTAAKFLKSLRLEANLEGEWFELLEVYSTLDTHMSFVIPVDYEALSIPQVWLDRKTKYEFRTVEIPSSVEAS